MDVFRRNMLQQFEDSMVEHVNHQFPEVCGEMEEPQVRETIRYGMERAGSYGITIEQEVSKYINLMFLFGRDFDVDTSFPWASGILRSETSPGPAPRKIDRLYEEASAHLQDAKGLDGTGGGEPP